MRIPFPQHLSHFPQLLRRLVSIMEEGSPNIYAFAFLESNFSIAAVVDKNESVSNVADTGVVLRIFVDGKNLEVASNDLSEKHLIQIAESLKEKAKHFLKSSPSFIYQGVPWDSEELSALPGDLKKQLPSKLDADTQVHFSPDVTEDPSQITPEYVLGKTKNLRTEALSWDQAKATELGEKPLPYVMSNLRVRMIHHLFVDRHRIMSQSLPIILSVLVGQSSGGKAMRVVEGGLGGLEVAKLTKAHFEEALLIPRRLDQAEKLLPGEYPVITGPDVTGVIAHEAFGHTQEGDTVRQGRSISPSLMKEKVGNDMATIVNDPGVFEMEDISHGPNGSYYFDHEGQLARRQTILDHGQLSQPMTDLLSAVRLGVPRTANGKRESWRRPTLTRQTNTYFTAGKETLDSLIAKIHGKGYIALYSHGGMEDPKGANLTAGAEYFEEIVDGKRTGKYVVGPRGGHIELSGSVPKILAGILGKTSLPMNTSNDIPTTPSGGCGKYHKEYVMAGCGGPYILWDKLICG